MRFEDGTTIRLYRQTMEDFSISAGLEMTDQQMELLLEAAGAMSAKMRAVRIVAASGISKKSLEERLVHKGEDPKQAKDAVQWMAELNLVDDRKTAEQIVHRCAAKGYGIARAKQALFEGRIPKELWDEALVDYPDQTEAILSFLRNKLTECNDPRQRQKVVNSLLRKGHSYSQIRHCLDSLSIETDDFPED